MLSLPAVLATLGLANTTLAATAYLYNSEFCAEEGLCAPICLSCHAVSALMEYIVLASLDDS
jgi:hypothetical protein